MPAYPAFQGRRCTPLALSALFLVSALGAPMVWAQTAAAAAPPGRMIEIVLDASGSMAGSLSGGGTKLDAARSAVGTLVGRMPDASVVAFRAYGHQSGVEKHDCVDTRLLTAFGSLGTTRVAIVDQAKQLRPRGYTPITYVLGEAAKDFPATHAGETVIVLVSDGKETCKGDPCALAQELARKNSRLVVHTVGFGVDDAARTQLQCVAKAAGGRYFDAANANDLAAALGKAVETARGVVVEAKGPGWLKVEHADIAGQTVTRADTGAEAGKISYTQSTIKLDAGLYNVTIGRAVWKSVEVEPGKTTVLQPAMLKVERASLNGHRIVDRETREEHASVSATHGATALMPGDYDVMFGPLGWPVSLKAGEVRTLSPGSVEVRRASLNGHPIRSAQGVEVARPGATQSVVPLPPGNYEIDIGGKAQPFALREGERLSFEIK